MLNWTWGTANPDYWQVQQSNDGVSGWTSAASDGGSTRTHVGLTVGKYFRVVGFTAPVVQFTDPSNVILLT